MKYKIYCFLPGDSTVFEVKILETGTVAGLKKKIKKEKKIFDAVDADELTLYRVNIDASDLQKAIDEAETISQGLSTSGDVESLNVELRNPLDGLKDVFPQGPAPRTLHILVQPPRRSPNTPKIPQIPPPPTSSFTSFFHSPPSSFTCFIHTPPRPCKQFDDEINRFLDRYRPAMLELLKKADNLPLLLPSWKLDPSADEELARHISELHIPTVSNRPSLLLHNLGEVKDKLDEARNEHIRRIFSEKHTVLVNTSGSGKTRLLLDGLCSRWGFYFVAEPDTTGIGSPDFSLVTKELDGARHYKEAKEMKNGPNPTQTSAAFNHMRETVERRLAQLLLARFLLLRLLIEVARELPEGLQQKEHRRLWVLLQAQPNILGRGPQEDIFTGLTFLLRDTSISDLKHRIHRQHKELENLLKVHDPTPVTHHFFCVLDEAQITISERNGEFISQDNKTERPILREIWRSWDTVLTSGHMHLVISGTGIGLQLLQDTLKSPTHKQPSYHLVHEIGGFDDPKIQAEYIKRYVPMCEEDSHWVGFLPRAWAWLRGRYRSTATLISLILLGGYQSPHRTIDNYVEAMTDFRPTDGKDTIEPPLPLNFEVTKLNFELNFEDLSQPQRETLCNAIYGQILHGRYDFNSFTQEDTASFVQYGFARHRDGEETVINEPLAVLAAMRWLDQQSNFSMFNCLRRNIHRHSTRDNGFEAYLTFYLRQVFKDATNLDAVFTLRDDYARLTWQREEFELVTVASANRDEPQVSVVTPTSGPSSNVGLLAKKGREVLQWITDNNNQQFTFCFPPESFGPDLLFFLRHKKSGQLLLVAIQAKRNTRKVNRPTLMKGIRTVTPSWFWKRKHEKYATADTAQFTTGDDATLASQTKDALAKIPLGLKVEGADYPILRVFASWPGDARLQRSRKAHKWGAKHKWGGADPDKHPLATLHLENFRSHGEELDRNWFRGDKGQQRVAKRVREAQDSESSGWEKRRKRCSSSTDS